MKKYFTLVLALFAFPAFAQSVPTAAQVAAQQATIASDFVAIEQAKATCATALTAAKTTKDNDEATLDVMNAQVNAATLAATAASLAGAPINAGAR